MTLDDLPTPCLVLDIGVLRRNIARMAAAIARHPGVALRPHLKTAKSRDVARLAAPDHGPVTVSTLAEARHFAEGGWSDQIYAVGITPQKLVWQIISVMSKQMLFMACCCIGMSRLSEAVMQL